MKDFSQYKTHAIQAVVANQPVLVTDSVNGMHSLEFDGAADPNNDYLVVADAPHLQIAGDITIISCVKVPDNGVNMSFYEKRNGADRIMFYTTQVNNRLYFNINTVEIFATPYEYDVYNIFGCSNDDIDSLIYINGALSNSGNVNNPTGAIGADIIIGSFFDNTAPLDGNFQYVVIFDYALSAEEHAYMNSFLRTLMLLPKEPPVLELEVDTPSLWKDVAGRGLNGVQATVLRQPTLADSFNSGKCYEFDGVASPNNDTFAIPYNSIIRLNDNFTFSIWINTKSVAANSRIASNYRGVPARVMINYNNGTVQLYMTDSVSTVKFVSSTITVNDGNWHKLIFQRHSGYIWIYIDGKYNNRVNEGTLADCGNIGDMYFACNLGDTSIWDGKQLRPRIYQYGLSAIEIASQYRMDLLTLRR
jgi:hypothetical protein